MSVQTNQRTLKRGDSGKDVGVLQSLMNRLDSAGLIEDEEFGPKTETAVMNYQRSRGLRVDGIVGPKTWARLLHELN